MAQWGHDDAPGFKQEGLLLSTQDRRMTNDLILFRTAEGEFRRVERTPYDSEELLQTLVEDHPDVLSG